MTRHSGLRRNLLASKRAHGDAMRTGIFYEEHTEVRRLVRLYGPVQVWLDRVEDRICLTYCQDPLPVQYADDVRYTLLATVTRTAR